MTDSAELLAGTDPTDRESVLRTLGLLPAAGGASALVRTVPGRSYQVDVSGDLMNWQNLGDFKAASWPATDTSLHLPAATLPPEAADHLFIRVAPVR